jgi:hypothetical protein
MAAVGTEEESLEIREDVIENRNYAFRCVLCVSLEALNSERKTNIRIEQVGLTSLVLHLD